MISPEKLTKKKLAKILVGKHKKFLDKYQKESAILKKIMVIKEKQDLLEHWLTSTKNSKKENNYLKKLENSDQELKKLKDQLNSFHESEFEEKNIESRYNWLKEKIKKEEEGLTYWQRKQKE